MSLTIKSLGTNGLFIHSKHTRILIDPLFTRPSKLELLGKIAPDPARIQAALNHISPQGIDAILLTHTHYDHAMDAFEAARRSMAVVYGSGSARFLALGSAIQPGQFHAISPPQDVQIGDFTVTFLTSTHLPLPFPLSAWMRRYDGISEPLAPPAWLWQYRAGEVFSFILQHEDHRILLQGSTGFLKEGQVLPRVDSAVLGIGGLGLQSRSYIERWFEQVLRQSGASQVYFSHWDDFMRPPYKKPHMIPGTRRVLKLIENMARGHPPVSLRLLAPGEAIEFQTAVK